MNMPPHADIPKLIHSEKMASLGLLVAGVAHELNNPISFVLGNVHALRKYCDRLQTYMTALQAQVDDPSLGGAVRAAADSPCAE